MVTDVCKVQKHYINGSLNIRIECFGHLSGGRGHIRQAWSYQTGVVISGDMVISGHTLIFKT